MGSNRAIEGICVLNKYYLKQLLSRWICRVSVACCTLRWKREEDGLTFILLMTSFAMFCSAIFNGETKDASLLLA